MRVTIIVVTTTLTRCRSQFKVYMKVVAAFIGGPGAMKWLMNIADETIKYKDMSSIGQKVKNMQIDRKITHCVKNMRASLALGIFLSA